MNTGENGKFRNVRLLIFDLDGTLIDSEADLTLSVNAALRQMGMKPLPQPVIASYVGQGVPVLVRRALGPSVPENAVEEAVVFFLDYYRQHMLDHTVLYPGVQEALEGLKDLKLAVLTNKPVNFSRRILAGLKVDHYFSSIYGGNSFQRKKPDPVGVLHLIEETGVSASRTLMIGDSETDVLTGRNAGVWTCGVTYGIGSRTLAAAGPDLMLDDLRKLRPLLKKCSEDGGVPDQNHPER